MTLQGMMAAESPLRMPMLQPGFLGKEEGDSLLQAALTDLEWHIETFTIFGRTRNVPRLISWAADAGLDYRYAGRSHPGTGWPTWLAQVRDRLHDHVGYACNHVLLNRYRSGTDHMGWHRDDERGVEGDILVLSLGAPRTLRWRHLAHGASHALQLEHGSLLRLDGRLQHRLLAAPGQTLQRISLTFRQLRDPVSPDPHRALQT